MAKRKRDGDAVVVADPPAPDPTPLPPAPLPVEPAAEEAPKVSLEEALGHLTDMLGFEISTDDQLAAVTMRDLRHAARALRELLDDVRDLRDALEPFAEIARRMGWHEWYEDDMRLGEHVVEAPAPDIAPDAVYCLMIGAFWRAAHLLNGDHENKPAASTFDSKKRKRWWR